MDLQTSYDTVAEEYAKRLFDELQHKPLDRQVLEQFAAAIQPTGIVADLGCGPGHVTQYLSECGLTVIGFDISPGMIAQAARLNPGLQFRVADMRALPVTDQSWAGIVAFYSLLHFARAEVVTVLRECLRALQPGGLLLVAFHVGDEIRRIEEFWGHAVQLDFVFFQLEEMAGYLRTAGFEVEEVIERGPYPDVEVQTHRVYLFARKPA